MIRNQKSAWQFWVPKTPWKPIWALLVLLPLGVVSLLVSVLVFVSLSEISHSTVLTREPSVGNLIELDRGFIGVLSVFAAQLTMVSLVLWVAGLGEGRRKDVLSLRPFREGMRAGALVFTAFLGLAFFVSFGTYLLFPFDIGEIFPEIVQVAQSHLAGYLLIFLIHVVGAPLSEEFVFRGFLFPAFAQSRIGMGGAAIVTGGLWTMLHLGHPLQVLFVVFIISVLLGVVLLRTGSLWMCVGCHATYNLVAFCFLPIPHVATW